MCVHGVRATVHSCVCVPVLCVFKCVCVCVCVVNDFVEFVVWAACFNHTATQQKEAELRAWTQVELTCSCSHTHTHTHTRTHTQSHTHAHTHTHTHTYMHRCVSSLLELQGDVVRTIARSARDRGSAAAAKQAHTHSHTHAHTHTYMHRCVCPACLSCKET